MKDTSTLSWANVAAGKTQEKSANPSPATQTKTEKSSVPAGKFNSEIDITEVFAALIDMRSSLDKNILMNAFTNALPDLRQAQTKLDFIYLIYRSYNELAP